MHRKLVVFVVLVVLVIGAAGFAFAGSWVGGPARKGDTACTPQARVEAISGLNLSDEQYASIRGFMSESFERMSQFRNVMAQKMHELRLMYWQKDPDLVGIEAKEAEITQLREEMRDQRNVHDQILEILDDEQKEAFEQVRGFGFRGGRGMSRMMRMKKGG